MNFRLLSKVLGTLLLLMSGAMLLCVGYAYLAHEHQTDANAVRALWVSISLTFLAGLALAVLGRHSGRQILRKETIAIVGVGWLLCACFGALPYLFGEPHLPPAAAFFESMSGLTTTGATVITDLDEYPRSILLWRGLTQWLGGLGILVLFVALLSYLGVGSKALFRHESSAKTGEGLQTRIHDVAVRLFQIYVGLSAICWLGLVALGMSAYEATVHTFTCISTGGFSTRNESIAAFASLSIELWITLFMILGAISFMLYAWLLRGRWERWRRDEETKFFLAILAVAILVIAVDLIVLQPEVAFLTAFRQGAFNIVAIMTTTGYATADFDQWPPFSRIILLMLMFIGGCAGSTSSGVKVGRWLLFFKVARAEIIAMFRPKQVIPLRLNGNLADDSFKVQTVFFIAMGGVTLALGTVLIGLFEPQLDIVSSFSAVMATLFNIGPGLGAVGPAQNFAHLSAPSHVFLSFAMALGRLEFFAILVLFLPSLWRKY